MCKDECPYKSKEYAITVCRIEPENNIHNILEAFSSQSKIPLVAVGNWNAGKYGLGLRGKYSICRYISLFDPIYERDKINRLRLNALLYIHGHSAGGTNPSLVEAMFLGLPVFAFDCVYNRLTTENKAVYWENTDKLKSLLRDIDDISLDYIGAEMKRIASGRYTWEIINRKYEALYA